MNRGLIKMRAALLLALLMPLTSQAVKWGATPDVYTISSIEPGPGDDDLLVTFFLDGAGAAPETVAMSFAMTCAGETFAGAGSPIIVTGLTDDAEYICTVVATNTTGSSSSSIGILGYPNGVPEVIFNGLNIILIKAALDAR